MDILESRRSFETYLTAWSAVSAEERRRVLESTVSPKISYFDAMAQLSGREALAAHLAGFQQRRPHYKFSPANYLQHSDAVLAN